MPVSHAQIPTARADRYLSQLCDHLDRLSQAAHHHGSHDGHPAPTARLTIDRSDHRATVTFEWGTCTLQATETALHVRVEAPESAALDQAETLLAHRVRTIGARDQLTVEWRRDPP
jgi:hypothetical protein